MTNPPNASFHVGSTYSTRRAGDHTMVVTATITSRTAKFVTFDDLYGDSHRCKVSIYNGVESILPEGRHSMCPVITAA